MFGWTTALRLLRPVAVCSAFSEWFHPCDPNGLSMKALRAVCDFLWQRCNSIFADPFPQTCVSWAPVLVCVGTFSISSRLLCRAALWESTGPFFQTQSQSASSEPSYAVRLSSFRFRLVSVPLGFCSCLSQTQKKVGCSPCSLSICRSETQTGFLLV